MIREIHADERSLFDGYGLFPRRWCMLCKHCSKLVNLRATALVIVSSQHDPVLHAIWSIVALLGVDRLVSCGVRDTLNHQQGDRWASALVELRREEDGTWRMRHREGVRPFESDDPDSARIFWREGGVHQNLTFPVHPDPISGMHCWHQKVRVEPAHEGDRYGDVFVDTAKAYEVYKGWLAMTRPQLDRADGLRRLFAPT